MINGSFIMEGILFGLDIGTTKICALVGEVRDGQLQIIGLGIEPSNGLKKGMVVDVNEATDAIAKAVEAAEQTSGYQLERAIVSMAGEHLESCNGKSSVVIPRGGDGVTRTHIAMALEAARTMVVPPEREVVHLVPRSYAIDGQNGIVSPLGMVGGRMEIEAHIVTASATALQNIGKCTRDVGLQTEEFVLNCLASAECVLDPTERDMGVIVVDIGGGTTDIAIFTQGTVWHTDVIPLGGQHFTNDIAIGLRVPFEIAEEVKLRHGTCLPDDIDPANTFKVKPFSGEQIDVGLQDLAKVVEARAEELFDMILDSIKGSGYEGLLPAGIVLTGGGSQLRHLTAVAERILGVPARIGHPRNLLGLVDRLQSPAYATGVGLLRWALSDYHNYRPIEMQKHERLRPAWPRNRDKGPREPSRIGEFLKNFLPG
ncbi:MAG TPA: cell division protein FtsA [Anaerolineae bacterium]|nr:cell division protein FtsA [Anaerolineae bacterium]